MSALAQSHTRVPGWCPATVGHAEASRKGCVRFFDCKKHVFLKRKMWFKGTTGCDTLGKVSLVRFHPSICVLIHMYRWYLLSDHVCDFCVFEGKLAIGTSCQCTCFNDNVFCVVYVTGMCSPNVLVLVLQNFFDWLACPFTFWSKAPKQPR